MLETESKGEMWELLMITPRGNLVSTNRGLLCLSISLLTHPGTIPSSNPLVAAVSQLACKWGFRKENARETIHSVFRILSKY